MSYKFPVQSRIRRREDFQEVYRRGSRLKIFPIRIHYLQRPGADGSRLGLALGKRTGPAVLRNRWKRAIREAFRLHRSELETPCDIVVSVSWNAGREDVEKTQGAFLKAVSLINGR